EVYVERRGLLERVPEAFETPAALNAAITNIAQYVGRVVNENHPTMEARLPDGSRVHVIVPPCARGGSFLAIRKFQKAVFDAAALLSLGSLSEPLVRLLEICVGARKSIVFSGGSGSGKTSLLNFASSFIPDRERVIVIEDATELQLKPRHVLYLEVKTADKEGRGEVSVRDLVRASLRMRPDRILVGEVRGGEALVVQVDDHRLAVHHAGDPVPEGPQALLELELRTGPGSSRWCRRSRAWIPRASTW
ncbi:MAG: Flp pilus assembly complex ATPase component TadA, partial [Planctomycetes bacterium]|nr:Flp pilus assembly complex ATPase component TadA [Planctomycetota bacterium]